MKWPHMDVGQKENHMPLPHSKVTTFPQSEEQSLRQQVTSFEKWRALAGAWPLKRLVALWNDLPGVLPVHEPGDSARENLAVSSPARTNDATESGRTEEPLSGRVKSSPGVCAVGPPGGGWVFGLPVPFLLY